MAEKCRKNLIITADDLAYSTGRTEGIVAAFRQEAVTRASVIVNGKNVEHDIKLALDNNLPLGEYFIL